MGRAFDAETIEAAIKTVRPKLLAIVQGDTSTMIAQHLDDLGAICRDCDVLFYCDATASIAGNQFLTDEWVSTRCRLVCRSVWVGRPVAHH